MSTIYKIRNKKTKRFVTKPIDSVKASKLMSKLSREHYELVTLDTELKKLSAEKRPITDEERKAIESLKWLTFSTYTSNHIDFANSMLEIIAEDKPQITDKQAAYLWWLVYHYRKQIGDKQLVSLAERNKVF